jgi:hypothetical protein
MTRARLGAVATWFALACALTPLPAGAADSDDFTEWGELSFWTDDAECVVHADSWSLDVCAHAPIAPGQQLKLQIVDDELHVLAGEHVLAVDPQSGQVQSQWLGGVPEPKDPGPSPKKSGCDCTFARSDPPVGMASFALLVTAVVVSRARRRARRG